jgi:hypothetical protein
VALVCCATLIFVSSASADVTIHGGKAAYRERLAALLEEHWSADQLGRVNLAITVGLAGLAEFCEKDRETPVLATYLYQSRFADIAASCSQPVVPIFADTPLSSMGRLAEALFPGVETAMLSGGFAKDQAKPEHVPHILLPVPPEGVAKGLGRLIDEGRWGVLLLPLDSRIFKATDYRLSLETLFRHRKPAIVSIHSLLNQGAAAATYYKPEQLEEAVVRSIEHLMQSGELVGKQPDRVSVDINKTVLRNLYGRVITEEELHALEAEVNGG